VIRKQIRAVGQCELRTAQRYDAGRAGALPHPSHWTVFPVPNLAESQPLTSRRLLPLGGAHQRLRRAAGIICPSRSLPLACFSERHPDTIGEPNVPHKARGHGPPSSAKNAFSLTRCSRSPSTAPPPRPGSRTHSSPRTRPTPSSLGQGRARHPHPWAGPTEGATGPRSHAVRPARSGRWKSHAYEVSADMTLPQHKCNWSAVEKFVTRLK
jgi:hypothetical protein